MTDLLDSAPEHLSERDRDVALGLVRVAWHCVLSLRPGWGGPPLLGFDETLALLHESMRVLRGERYNLEPEQWAAGERGRVRKAILALLADPALAEDCYERERRRSLKSALPVLRDIRDDSEKAANRDQPRVGVHAPELERNGLPPWKEIRCPECGTLKLHLIQQKERFRVGCLDCGHTFDGPEGKPLAANGVGAALFPLSGRDPGLVS
jgi:hypothetical protein